MMYIRHHSEVKIRGSGVRQLHHSISDPVRAILQTEVQHSALFGFKTEELFTIRNLDNKLIYKTCSLDEGRRQADKLDNSYSHEQLWDDHFNSGEYIDYPRGRVIWDCSNNCAIIYIDRCISNPEVILRIIEVFDLRDYTVKFDTHYCCQNCTNTRFPEFQ